MSHKIAFREYGHGPILILLHGYGGSVSQWDSVVESLQNQYRVVVPNLTHLYLSEHRLLFPIIIEKVSEFITQHFPNEKVSVAGMSFGAAVAWGLALRKPEAIARIMLFNPLMPHPVEKFCLPEVRYFFVMPMDRASIAKVFPTPIGQAFLGRAGEIFRPHRKNAASVLPRLEGRRLEFVAELISHFSWILRNEDWNHWVAQLGKIEVPTMLAWTKDDLLFNNEAYESFAKEIKATRVETIDQGGHILTFTQPDWVADLCDEFMSERRRHLRKSA